MYNVQKEAQRILHVVENLNRGAVENWLVRMFEHAQKRGIEVDWTFYCALGQRGAMDERARSLRARVVYSPVPIGKKAEFVRALRTELTRGEYDVLHCHHDIVSAIYLLAAWGLPIHRKIVHVHNADEAVLTPSRLRQRLYREPMRQICLRSADRLVGISDHTLDTFLAGRARRPERDSVHYYGVDSTPFENVCDDRLRFRRQLGLPQDALILLFGGRLGPRAFAVFAGAGSLEMEVLAQMRRLGMEGSVHLLGWRNDLPDVMNCSDCFILPHPDHPVEGFGVAIVEAQLAGLPMLLSRGILDDPLLPTACFRRLALSDGPMAWAKAAIDLLHHPAPSRAAALDALRASPMDMDQALAGLLRLHA